MKKKYILLENDTIDVCGITLYRIQAIRSFGNASEGDKGGYIQREKNLSHNGDCWVCGDARVYDNAWVFGDACVFGDARVYGDAWVFGDARVYGDAWVCGDARVYGYAQVTGKARVGNDDDHCGFDCFGSENRHTHAYRTADGSVEVACGCFLGSLDEFRRKVEQKHAGTVYEKQYKAIIEVIKIKFGIE